MRLISSHMFRASRSLISRWRGTAGIVSCGGFDPDSVCRHDGGTAPPVAVSFWMGSTHFKRSEFGAAARARDLAGGQVPINVPRFSSSSAGDSPCVHVIGRLFQITEPHLPVLPIHIAGVFHIHTVPRIRQNVIPNRIASVRSTINQERIAPTALSRIAKMNRSSTTKTVAPYPFRLYQH